MVSDLVDLKIFNNFCKFSTRHLEPFSITKGSSSRRKVIKRVFEVPVYGTCKMPDTSTLYVICDVCIGLDHRCTTDKLNVVHLSKL